jgi:hypothetical protein
MLPLLSYQMSVFGDYLSITPDLELSAKLANAPSDLELLPSIVKIIVLDKPNDLSDTVLNSPYKVNERFQLEDTAKKWNIIILPDRIDVNYVGSFENDTVEWVNVSETALKLTHHLISTCNISFDRIGINMITSFIPDENDDEKIIRFCKKLINPLDFQSNNNFSDWEVGGKIQVDFETSKANIIHSLSERTIGASSRESDNRKHIVALLLDINTNHTNEDMLFENKTLDLFRTQTIRIFSSILTEIKEKWDNA